MRGHDTTGGVDEPLAERFPALAGQAPQLAEIFDRYEVVHLRGDDRPYTLVEWGSPLGRHLGLLCRRQHGGTGPTVLVQFTFGGDIDVLPGLDLRTGDDYGTPIRIGGHQNPTTLADLVEQALGHESEEHEDGEEALP